MNVGKESVIKLKGQESESPYDAFLLLHIMFLFVSVWSMARSERTADSVVIDGRIRTWLYF